ncbi:MAG: hypothetical protein AB7T49_08300 [Oligoflexales bacterium]
MHVIWKRPDGFHEASPSDYSVFELNGHAKLWLHKKDKDQYPFRISGGWEEGDSTVKLNNFVNLLPQPDKDWVSYLVNIYNNSMKSDAETFFNEKVAWLNGLKSHLKGDTWEVDILEQAIELTKKKLESVKLKFLEQVSA